MNVLPVALTLAPLVIPRIRRGAGRIWRKYRGVPPLVPITTLEPFRGGFPERDHMGTSLLFHSFGAFGIVGAFLTAAVKEAELRGWSDPVARGMVAFALAFSTDQTTHFYLAGGPEGAGPKGVDGVMQRAHALDTLPLLLLVSAANYSMGAPCSPAVRHHKAAGGLPVPNLTPALVLIVCCRPAVQASLS